MDPSSLTTAGQAFLTSWKEYLETPNEKSLQNVFDRVKELEASFAPQDFPLFDAVRETIKAKHLNLTELDQTVAKLSAKVQPEGPITAIPLELLPLFLRPLEFSKKDIQIISLVSRAWKNALEDPVVLANVIHRAGFEIPLDVLLKFLRLCGQEVRSLDLCRLLSTEDRHPAKLTPEKLQEMLRYCPRLENVLFYFVRSLSDKIVLEHFSSAPFHNAIKTITIFESYREKFPSAVVLETLKKSCPQLDKVEVIRRIDESEMPDQRLLWLQHGKEYAEFDVAVKKLNGKLQEHGLPPLDEGVFALAPPDLLLDLPSEKINRIAEVAMPVMTLGFFGVLGIKYPDPRKPTAKEQLKIADLMVQFIRLPETTQKQILEVADCFPLIVALREGKSLQEGVKSLPLAPPQMRAEEVGRSDAELFWLRSGKEYSQYEEAVQKLEHKWEEYFPGRPFHPSWIPLIPPDLLLDLPPEKLHNFVKSALPIFLLCSHGLVCIQLLQQRELTFNEQKKVLEAMMQFFQLPEDTQKRVLGVTDYFPLIASLRAGKSLQEAYDSLPQK